MLHWGDIVVLALFLTISVGIGIYHGCSGGKQQTTGEFIMANRKLHIIPTMVSLFATYLSGIGILGYTSETYQYGFEDIVLGPLSACIGYIIAGCLLVTWIYPLKLISINEYVYRRFRSKLLLRIVSIMSIVYLLVYIGVAMYAPSLAIEHATGLSVRVGIPIMATVSTLYTTLGGMRAVVWTDVFQFVVMFAGLITVVIVGVVRVGGFRAVFMNCYETERCTLIHVDPNPQERHTIWGYIFGRMPIIVYTAGLSQAAVQRYSATTSIQKARWTVWLLIPPTILTSLLLGLIGLISFTYYSNVTMCDPIKSKQVAESNQVFVHFVMQLFVDAPGVTGLMLATLYSGALSTVSSGLSGCAALMWEDIFKAIGQKKKLSEKSAAIFNRVLVCMCGLVSMALAFVATRMTGPITQVSLTLFAVINGPLFGLLLLGGISRRSNAIGALVGVIVGILVNIWLMGGIVFMNRSKVLHQWLPLPPAPSEGCTANSNTTTAPTSNSTTDASLDYTLYGLENLYMISYNWYGVIGMGLAMGVGYIVSLLINHCRRDDTTEDEPDAALMLHLSSVWPCSLCCKEVLPRETTTVKPLDSLESGKACGLAPVEEIDIDDEELEKNKLSAQEMVLDKVKYDVEELEKNKSSAQEIVLNKDKRDVDTPDKDRTDVDASDSKLIASKSQNNTESNVISVLEYYSVL